MTKLKLIVIAFLLSSAVFIFVYINRLYAQEKSQGIDITVSPTFIELTNLPGAKIQSRFRLRNNMDIPLKLQLSIGKLTTNTQTDAIEPIETKPGDDFLGWIKFDSASISAKPKEWTDVQFSIDVPKTAAFGYYYAIRIKQVPISGDANSVHSKVVAEVLIPILLDVQKEGARAEAQILSFKSVSLLNEYLPVEFETRIKNTGNIHIRLRGNIFIHTGGDKDTAILEVNPGRGIILPESARSFYSNWDDGFFVLEPVMEDGIVKVDSNHKPLTNLVINWNKLTSFRIGKYAANLLIVYDNGKRDVALEANTTFWVFPYKIIGGFVVVIIVLFILIRFLLKLYIKRQLRKYKHSELT